MPLPSTTKVSGTPDEPSAIWTRLVGVGADRAERIAIVGEEAGESSRPVADRDAVDRHAAPLRASSSCGASAMQGTHQLAKMLTRRGSPPAKVGAGQARPARRAPAAARIRAPACRSAASGSLRSAGASEPDRDHDQEDDEHGQRHPEDQRASCQRLLERRRAGARAAAGRSAPAGRRARPAPPPSQIRVTNGFHHSRSCQRPCSSASPSTV